MACPQCSSGEMVDALASGASVSNDVGVQLSPRAQRKGNKAIAVGV